MIIYDAENQILGRLCSVIAKKLLREESVAVVNAEKAVISGKPKVAIKAYLDRVRRGDPLHGPFYPKTPSGIFRRTVRGMLPWHKHKGRQAYKRLRVFISMPEEFIGKKLERVEAADASKLRTKYITLADLSLALGAKKRW